MYTYKYMCYYYYAEACVYCPSQGFHKLGAKRRDKQLDSGKGLPRNAWPLRPP